MGGRCDTGEQAFLILVALKIRVSVVPHNDSTSASFLVTLAPAEEEFY